MDYFKKLTYYSTLVMPQSIAIIGLGRTGMAASRAYLAAGYTVFGCDKRPEARAELEAMGGTSFQVPEEVANRVSTILIMVLNDQQVMEVLAGTNGLLEKTTAGNSIICMSTINRSGLEVIARMCAEKNVHLLDCPFTGGPARIADASLTLIAAGPPELVASVRADLEIIGRVVLVGDKPGMGQAVKHCNQLLVGATHAATMEVITLAGRLGLDAGLVCRVAGSGIAGSDYFRLLAESVLEQKPSPGGLGQMCKDVAIVAKTVEEAGMPAYVARAAQQYFAMAAELGMEEREGAALIEVVDTAEGKHSLDKK